MRKFRTIEEKKRIIAAVEDLISSGMPAYSAAKEQGISAPLFKKWKQKLGGSELKYTDSDTLVQKKKHVRRASGKNIFAIYGPSDEVLRAIKEMSAW